jgi:hypothetical protein
VEEKEKYGIKEKQQLNNSLTEEADTLNFAGV